MIASLIKIRAKRQKKFTQVTMSLPLSKLYENAKKTSCNHDGKELLQMLNSETVPHFIEGKSSFEQSNVLLITVFDGKDGRREELR